MKQTKLLEWEQVIKMSRLSPESKFLRLILVAGIPVSSGQIAQTWFDDLKIYQDDVLIYENIFSDWAPYTGAALGAGIGVIAGVIVVLWDIIRIYIQSRWLIKKLKPSNNCCSKCQENSEHLKLIAQELGVKNGSEHSSNDQT